MTGWDWRSIAADRRIRWLGGLIGTAILMGLLAAWLSRGDFKGRYAIPELGADKTVATSQVAQAPAVPPMAIPPALAHPIPAPPPPVVARQVEPQPEPASTAENEDDDAARMARAIDRAARKALDRGEPVRWHKAGESGYVVVSDVRDFGDHACRNVSATINRDDGPAQSSSHLWCTTPDGDWAPAE